MLVEKYKKEVIPALQAKFSYKNILAVPRITKAVVNTGIGRFVTGKSAKEQQEIVKAIARDLSMITGQYPAVAQARKSVAAFKVRQGMPLGLKVTLRGRRMYDFLTRLISIAFPRSRDFRGIPLSSVDKEGNLTVGVKEVTIFPELLPEEVRYVFGFEVAVVTSAKSREEAIELLRLMGFPLQK